VLLVPAAAPPSGTRSGSVDNSVAARDPEETPAETYQLQSQASPPIPAPAQTRPLALPKTPGASTRRAAAQSSSSPGKSPRPIYWLLFLALIPLGVFIWQKEDSVLERLETTMEHQPPEVIKSFELKLKPQGKERESDEPTMDDVLDILPEHQLDGALLSRHSWLHWGFALVSGAGFFGFLLVAFPRGTEGAREIFLTGLFTATIGILFLFIVQFAAEWTQGFWMHGRSIVVLFFYILKFIGWSYRSALDPGSNFFLSFIGFTCGVGICEELCKSLPLLYHFTHRPRLSWQGACSWGLAAGIGFGVAEGIMYSSDQYNGVSGTGTYLVRFISCVALHAIWSGIAGMTICTLQEQFANSTSLSDLAGWTLIVLAVPAVLHGLYDTLLKKDMSVLALGIAVVSFAVFAVFVERLRRDDRALSPAGA
jgi:RsiW-degrading membrane proteinase PrsW (M82 family)